MFSKLKKKEKKTKEFLKHINLYCFFFMNLPYFIINKPKKKQFHTLVIK